MLLLCCILLLGFLRRHGYQLCRADDRKAIIKRGKSIVQTSLWSPNPWGRDMVKQMMNPENTVRMGQPSFVHLKAARRMGRRRLSRSRRQPRPRRMRRTLTISWRPGTPSASAWQAYPNVLLGGKQAGPRRLEVQASFPQGRLWRVYLQRGSTWGDCKQRLSMEMHRGEHTFDIFSHGERLKHNDFLPDHGYALEIQMIRRDPRQRSSSSSRASSGPRKGSRSPRGGAGESSAQNQEDPNEPPRRQAPRVIDVEAIQIEVATRDGVWTISASPEDFGNSSWVDVTVGMLERKLLMEYRALWGAAQRWALAADGCALRTQERVSAVLARGTQLTAQPPLVPGAVPEESSNPAPSYLYGLPAAWNPAVAQQKRLVNAFGRLQVAIPTDEGFLQWHTLDGELPEWITPSEIEKKLTTQYLDLEGMRYMMANHHHHILPPNRALCVRDAGPVIAAPAPPQGAKRGPAHATGGEVLQIAKKIGPLLQGQLQMRQIKLLLRGEPGLLARCTRLQSQPVRCKEVTTRSTRCRCRSPSASAVISRTRE